MRGTALLVAVLPRLPASNAGLTQGELTVRQCTLLPFVSLQGGGGRKKGLDVEAGEDVNTEEDSECVRFSGGRGLLLLRWRVPWSSGLVTCWSRLYAKALTVVYGKRGRPEGRG